jgi:hypothetical protein
MLMTTPFSVYVHREDQPTCPLLSLKITARVPVAERPLDGDGDDEIVLLDAIHRVHQCGFLNGHVI